MPESPVRVALLARAGEVRQQLHRALTELGAEVVAEGDPAELDPGVVAAGRPAVVVVSLEPAIEDALAEFDDMLAMPGVQVIYDDAEVTGQLDGWDLARWARHLASKLAGSDMVLPPAPEQAVEADAMPDAGASLRPGAPPTPAEEMDHHRLEDYAVESLQLSDQVPTTPSLTDREAAGDTATVSDAGDGLEIDLDLGLELDLAGLEQAMAPVGDGVVGESAAEPDTGLDAGFAASLGEDTGADVDVIALDDFAALGDVAALDDAAALDVASAPDDSAGARPQATAATADDGDGEADLGDFLDLSVVESVEMGFHETPAPTAGGSEDTLLVDFEISDGPVSFSSFAADDDAHPVGVDDDIAALAAQLDALQADQKHELPRDPDFASLTPESEAEPEASPVSSVSRASPADPRPAATPAPSPAGGGFGNLELVPMDGDAGDIGSGSAATATAATAGAAATTAVSAAPSSRTAPPPAADAAAAPATVDFGNLSLVDDDSSAFASGATSSASATGSPAAAPASTTAVTAAAPAGARPGALLVLAGLGGPDGVRQLLAALPPTLPVPVLLYQHLDTGKHERLLGQLAKASRLPLDLAVDGGVAAAGRVSVLPPGLVAAWQGDACTFVPGRALADLVAALPAADSIVLVLSGGDPIVVPAVQALQAAGGRVLAQDPASCFDGVAPQALIAGGAGTGALPELARQIIERWS